MTRYTNIGRQRTYIQATFDPKNDRQASTTIATSTPVLDALDIQHESSVDTPVESNRRKRRRKSDGNSDAAGSATPIVASDGEKKKSVVKSEKTKKALAKLKAREKAKRAKSVADIRIASSEARRLKRIAERNANKTCFACREVGHSAKDCPLLPDETNEASDRTTKTKTVVGICYRCGSRKHNLARCRQPARPDNPLPFASCFVCTGRGHLASSCPNNEGKGVYPNGGSCKLCGETTHLAKNCTLRKIEESTVTSLLGTGRGAGADEDDFHTIRRKNAEMDRDELGDERVRKEAKVRAGALTGVVKAFGKAPLVKPKKTVYF